MIGLLAPAWLAALAALAVPLAIHLWSPRPRRSIRVGSIRLLTGIPPAATRSLRLRDRWLLLLRLGVLAALVLSLTDPFWAPRDQRPRTWALLSTEALTDRALLDSLRRAGAELRLLAAGLPLVAGDLEGTGLTPDGVPAEGCDLAAANCHPPHDWSLLREADRLAPPGATLVIAAPLTADRFRGTRPAIRAQVVWRDVPRSARADGAGRARPSSPAHRRVVILADAQRRDDARYLEAAVRAAATTTGRAAEIVRASLAAGASAATADWIVWLSAEPPPAPVVARARQGAVLFTQIGRDTVTTGGTVVRTAATGPPPVLARRAPFDGRGAALWTDGTGSPLLTVAREGSGYGYRLYGRIDPTGLALSPTFATAIAELWGATDGERVASVAPRITARQALPASGASPPRRGVPPGAVRLTMPLWVLAAAALALERWSVWRRSRDRTT